MTTTLVAAAYSRTSQDKDDAFSLSSQVKAIRAYAVQHNLMIQFEFQEEYTGIGVDRPKLNELLRLVQRGIVQAVIIYDATRLARKVGAAEYILDRIFETGIQLHLVSWDTYVRNTPRDIKTFYDEAVYAHIERMKIIERFTRGKADKISEGKWMCQGLDKYGFCSVGSKRNQHLELVEDEAKVIKAIFTMFYREQMRVVDIALGLTKAGYATPSKARKRFWNLREEWTPQMIYRILSDESYTGIFYANRYTQTLTDKGTKATRQKDESEWIRLEFPELAIVSREVFTATQDMLAEGRKLFAPQPKNNYLMNRRIKCGDCHYDMGSSTTTAHGNKYSYYVCNSRKLGSKAKRAVKCGLSIPCTQVDDIIYRFILELLDNPDRVLRELQQKQQQQLSDNEVAIAHVQDARRVLDGYENQLREYADLYVQKLITLGIFAERKADLDKRIETAKEVIAEYDARLKKRVITDTEIKQKVKEIRKLKQQFNGELSFTQLKAVVERFNIHAVVGTHQHQQNGCKEKRLFVGIVWDGQTTAYWADNQDSLNAVAMNSTFFTGVKITGSRTGTQNLAGIWWYSIPQIPYFRRSSNALHKR